MSELAASHIDDKTVYSGQQPPVQPGRVVDGLPIGRVTFLFSDVQGSTRLWEAHPAAMRQALTRHDQLIESLVRAHAGTVVRPRGEGDSRFAVFCDALDAVLAASRIQAAFHREPWSLPEGLKIRLALHTGEADLRDGDYYGSVVNRCARLRGAAHGGQTLISRTTADLVREHLPIGMSLRGLGVHQLKDLTEPEHVFQLLAEGSPADFPPLRSVSRLYNNLPVQTSSFIGRERELSEVTALLARTSLLTLTGTGGVGKTRLALQTALRVLGLFPDGVWLVDFAPLADPGLVLQALASVLGIPELEGRGLLDSVLDRIANQQVLLVLDNCEHVIQDCARLADTLLQHCPHLRILSTSREVLGLTGEVAWRVPSLPTPDSRAGTELERILAYDAVRLFRDRAAAVQPHFVLTDRNIAAVATICSRLDGIPLALELAAARTRLLNVEQIEQRLDDRFALLTAGQRTAMPRQQTLRATIAWSYDLLSVHEQQMFSSLAVFSGGWTLEACEAICSTLDAPSALELLGQLVSKSLVQVDEQEFGMRYRLLETLRQFAGECLAQSGRATALRDRHTHYFLEVTQQAGPFLEGADQQIWLRRLDAEHDNLRAALGWGLDHNPDAALCLAGQLEEFWKLRGHFSEGRDWLERALGLVEGSRSARAKALAAAGTMYWCMAQHAEAVRRHEAALALYRQLGDRRSIAFALNNVGINMGLDASNPDTNARSVGRSLVAESYEIYRELNDGRGMAIAALNLGELARQEEDQVAATKWYQQALALGQAANDAQVAEICLQNLGEVALGRGDHVQAGELFIRGLQEATMLGDRRQISGCLVGLASCAMSVAQAERAAILLGCSERVQRELGAPRHHLEDEEYSRVQARVHAALGQARFDAAWLRGTEMSLADAPIVERCRMS